MIATADGRLVSDVQPLARLNVTCIAEDANGRQQGTYGGGGRQSFSFLVDGDRHLRFAREAARQAVLNLDAVDAPAGEMTVVLGPGWPGILLHEAIGHGLEGDFNRKGTSAFANLLGQRARGALHRHRRRHDRQSPRLAERRRRRDADQPYGPDRARILRGYLQDRRTPASWASPRPGTAAARAMRARPPRMTNTFMLAGESTPDEILRSVDRGLYAVSFGGGQVDITSGKFVFSASEAYLIEGGQVTRPVKAPR
jgi:TldD protein